MIKNTTLIIMTFKAEYCYVECHSMQSVILLNVVALIVVAPFKLFIYFTELHFNVCIFECFINQPTNWQNKIKQFFSLLDKIWPNIFNFRSGCLPVMGFPSYEAKLSTLKQKTWSKTTVEQHILDTNAGKQLS